MKFAAYTLKMNIVSNLKSRWTLLKFMRVGLGSLILYSSIETGHVIGILAGGVFTLLSLFSPGVCFTGGDCYMPAAKKSEKKNANEELGTS